MGLFSNDKIINVAATVYNLAGEEKNRPQFLQSLVVRNILSGTKDSMGDSIRKGYLTGPAMRLRQFYRWARDPDNYGRVGMPIGKLASGDEINPKSVEIYIPHPAGTDVWSQHAVAGVADYSYWAEQWVMTHRPSQLDKAWAATHNRTTGKITIRFSDNSTVLFTPADFNTKATYIYIYYIIITNPQNNLTISYGSDQLMIYRVGSGKPGLDVLVKSGSDYGEFFPFIPVRIDNEFVTSKTRPKTHAQVTKAYRKATGGQFSDLVKSLKDNDNLDDIDYAYVVFGVSLNVVEPACKRYLYTFFEKLMFSQTHGPQAHQKWVASVNLWTDIYVNWRRWKAHQEIYQQGGSDPGPQPAQPVIPEPPRNTIHIHSKYNSDTVDTDYDVHLSWSFIINGTGTGKGRPGAKTNDCWIVYTGVNKYIKKYYSSASVFSDADDRELEQFRIYWQRSPNAYTYLDVIGMVHRNEIYDGKSVVTGVREALESADESGFIVPLHYETWRATPILDSSQMGTACTFLVLNSYKVTKKKWYQTTLFRIVLIIIIAVVTVIITGGAGVGLLGTHLAVGTALGFTAMTAAIVGAVVNAMAALVLTTLIEKVTAGFGELGPIIAAVLSIIIGNVIGGISTGTSVAINWNTFLTADNLLKLTEAVGAGIQKGIQEATMKIVEDMGDLAKQANEELAKVEEAFFAEFGYGKIMIDPMELFVDAKTIVAESPTTFLTRTTLTGSEIAEMSMDMLSNFAEYSIKLPNAFA